MLALGEVQQGNHVKVGIVVEAYWLRNMESDDAIFRVSSEW